MHSSLMTPHHHANGHSIEGTCIDISFDNLDQRPHSQQKSVTGHRLDQHDWTNREAARNSIV